MKLRNLILFAVVCALALPTFAESPVKAGKWQNTIEMDMPGMPFKVPPQTTTSCLTKEQAADATNAIPKGKNETGCTFSDVKVDGNTVSWVMTCEKQGMTGTGSMTYAGESYTGKMDLKVADHEMHMKYSGKRVGDCDAK